MPQPLAWALIWLCCISMGVCGILILIWTWISTRCISMGVYGIWIWICARVRGVGPCGSWTWASIRIRGPLPDLDLDLGPCPSRLLLLLHTTQLQQPRLQCIHLLLQQQAGAEEHAADMGHVGVPGRAHHAQAKLLGGQQEKQSKTNIKK